MEPFASSGVYVNFLGNEGEGRVRASYGVNYERLVALKDRYDPTNFFALNQNIKPTIKQREPCLRINACTPVHRQDVVSPNV